MPVLDICANCKRQGAYREKDTDKVCTRCKNEMKVAQQQKSQEEENREKKNK